MRLLFILFLTAFTSFPAYAEENTASGMKYTTMGTKKENDDGPKYLHIKRIAPVSDLKKQETKKETAPKDSFERVWEKYKSLAAGQPDISEKNSKSPAKAAPSAPAPTSMEQENTPPVGLQGILANYYKNKEKRGQMQTKNLAKPSETTEATAAQ